MTFPYFKDNWAPISLPHLEGIFDADFAVSFPHRHLEIVLQRYTEYTGGYLSNTEANFHALPEMRASPEVAIGTECKVPGLHDLI